MCSITGIYSDKAKCMFITIYNALTVLQHRGQDAAGMATVDNNNNLKCIKIMG